MSARTTGTHLTDGLWALINSSDQMQRMMNDWVFYESQGLGIHPSCAFIGKDRGWDGRFDGKLLGRTGVHLLQSKHHRSQTGAVAAIRRELPGEIAKAICEGADHLVFVTNAKLTAPKAVELEETPRGRLTSLTILHRAKLNQHLERHPAVLFKHFHVGPVPALLIPAEHFTTHESHLSPLSLQDEALTRIVDTMTSDPRGVHLVHARGGCGKSHLLRRIAERLAQRPNTIVRILVKPDQAVSHHVTEELAALETERVVILLDDAERDHERLLRELPSLVHRDPQYVVIVCCRSAAFESCHQRMQLGGSMAPPIVHEVPPLTEADLTTFVRQHAPTRCPEGHRIAAAIRYFQHTPYLLRLWAESYERGGFDPHTAASEHAVIRQRVLAECEMALQGIVEREQLIRFLGTIASAVPSQFDDPVLNAIAAVTGLSTVQIQTALDRLETGRVLRRVGLQRRFNPDTFGDLLFAQALGNEPSFRVAVVQHLLPLNAMGLATSLAAAGQLGDPTTAQQIGKPPMTPR